MESGFFRKLLNNDRIKSHFYTRITRNRIETRYHAINVGDARFHGGFKTALPFLSMLGNVSNCETVSILI